MRANWPTARKNRAWRQRAGQHTASRRVLAEMGCRTTHTLVTLGRPLS